MKLFISWSGEFSRKVAERLSIWIPTIIQTVEVFYSPDDIAKGENWGNRLSEELEQCNFGIVCLTPENITAPWIHFEAGALAKAANSRVSAIMLGITPSDIKGPLARLQNTAFNREDLFRLFQSINNSNNAPLKSETLKNAFDNSLDKLMREINTIINDYSSRLPEPAAGKSKREESRIDSDALQEILRIVRNLDNNRPLVSKSETLNQPPVPEIPVVETSSILSNPMRIVEIFCPESSFEEVISILRKHIFVSPSDMASLRIDLRFSKKLSVAIDRNHVEALLQDLHEHNIPARMGVYTR